METKLCKKCGVERYLEDFRMSKGYLLNSCKYCEKEYHKKYYQKNKDIIEEKFKDYKKEYRKNNKERFAETNRKRAREHYYKNKDDKLKYQKEYREKNKEMVYQKTKECRQKNKKHYAEYYKEYSIIRRKEPLYKFKGNIRALIKESFKKKGILKSIKTEKIVGLPLEELYNYLLNTFKTNYGYEWDGKELVHIDHINPLKQCNTEEEVIKCCYYTNLQLLKAKDNLKKSDKTDWRLNDD